MSYLDRAPLPPERKLEALKDAFKEHLEPVKPDPMAKVIAVRRRSRQVFLA